MCCVCVVCVLCVCVLCVCLNIYICVCFWPLTHRPCICPNSCWTPSIPSLQNARRCNNHPDSATSRFAVFCIDWWKLPPRSCEPMDWCPPSMTRPLWLISYRAYFPSYLFAFGCHDHILPYDPFPFSLSASLPLPTAYFTGTFMEALAIDSASTTGLVTN